MTAPRLSVWPPLPPAAWIRRRLRRLPFPLAEEGVALYGRARNAIVRGVGELGLAAGDEVLVPAYHHGSEVEALVRAKLVPRFYDATAGLAPDEDELGRLRSPRTRALYLVHTLGVPQAVARWRAWADAHALLLIEDAAQAWLAEDEAGRPVGATADLAVFCLYKTVGIPDGAALVLGGRAAPSPGTAGGARAKATVKRHAAWLVGRSRLLAAALPKRRRAYDASADFAVGEDGLAPARSSLFLLPRLADRAAADARRRNFRLLLDRIGELVPEPFAELPAGASPFAFPVEVDDKEGLLARLRRAGVEPLDFWSTPHPALPVADFPAAARRRARTLALPVHQELRPDDLERIVAAVRGGRRG